MNGDRRLFKLPWDLWNNQNSNLKESAVDTLVAHEQEQSKKELSENDLSNLRIEINTFFSGCQIEETKGMRANILEDLRQEIKNMVVAHAVDHELEYYHENDRSKRRKIQNYGQLKTMWKNDGSDEAFKNMVHICFLDFDLKVHWKEILENMMMMRHDLTYLREPPAGKRPPSKCVILMVNKAKQVVIKNLKDLGVNSHGRGLALRDNCNTLESKKGGKRFRRKPGEWYDYFYEFCPSQEVKKDVTVRASPRFKVSQMSILL